MPALLQFGTVLQCPHGGGVVPVPTGLRVRVGGGFALLTSDSYPVVGCPFMVGNKPQPCVEVRWQASATRVTIGAAAVLLASSTGLCVSAEQIVQGTAIVGGAQTRAKGV